MVQTSVSGPMISQSEVIERSVVIVGNGNQRLKLYGPFGDHRAAREWAEKSVKDGAKWRVATLFLQKEEP